MKCKFLPLLSARFSEADHANSIIAAGRADLCAIARPHLADPAWTFVRSGFGANTPISHAWAQYIAGKLQLERNSNVSDKWRPRSRGLAH